MGLVGGGSVINGAYPVYFVTPNKFLKKHKKALEFDLFYSTLLYVVTDVELSQLLKMIYRLS